MVYGKERLPILPTGVILIKNFTDSQKLYTACKVRPLKVGIENVMNHKIIDVLLTSGKLKSVKRAGWVREKMPDPESVAAHTWRICFLILLLEDVLKVDSEKLMRMALIHDISEAITGDYVIERGDKKVGEHDFEGEEKIVKNLFAEVDKNEKIFKFWKEQSLENSFKKTRESDILYQLGKIATAWQALEYELSGIDSKRCDEWWINAETHVKEPVLVELLELLKKKRKK